MSTTPTVQPSQIPGPQGTLAVYQRAAAADSGDGPGATPNAAPLPLVLLHADSGRASQWDPALAELPPDRAVVAFDFRGHGASEPARDGRYGFDDRAADLAAVADAFALGRFVLVAHSGGAGVALAYAAVAPGRVAGLLMVDPATDSRALPAEVRDGFVRDTAGPRALEVQQAYYATLAGDDPDVRARVLADAAAVDPGARAGVAAALAAWDPEPTLRAYRGPAFVLASPAADGQRTVYHLRPDLPHRVVPGVGHWIQLDRPAEVAAAVARFAAAVDAGAGAPVGL